VGKKTKIEYADSSLNLMMGCQGCELYDPEPGENHCYAASMIRRYAGRKGWPESFTEPAYFPERLEQVLKWSDLTGTERPDKPWLNGMPRVVFVNDLGDGFAPNVDPQRWLTKEALIRMGDSPHIWLLLTKCRCGCRSFLGLHRFRPMCGRGSQ